MPINSMTCLFFSSSARLYVYVCVCVHTVNSLSSLYYDMKHYIYHSKCPLMLLIKAHHKHHRVVRAKPYWRFISIHKPCYHSVDILLQSISRNEYVFQGNTVCTFSFFLSSAEERRWAVSEVFFFAYSSYFFLVLHFVNINSIFYGLK